MTLRIPWIQYRGTLSNLTLKLKRTHVHICLWQKNHIYDTGLT